MSHRNDSPHPVALGRLTIADVVNVARNRARVAQLSPEIEGQMQQTAEWVESVVREIEERGEEARAYYGINTGFGANAGLSAVSTPYETRVVSRNLIVSHSAGVGEYFDEETVRATMLIRANSLAQGYSGVRPLIVRKLIDMLNERVYPAVPSRGSVGASGDLIPLSHLALTMSIAPIPPASAEDLCRDKRTGEAFIPVTTGEALDNRESYHITTHRVTGEQTLWRRVSGEVAMASAGGPVELQAKEGLALNNGATFSAAIATLTLHDAVNLVENAEVALAMTLEALRGFRDPFLPKVHQLRAHPGAQETAANVLRYVKESTLLDRGDHNVDPERIPPQDPYSVRCSPQVLGVVRDTLSFVRQIVEAEINAVTDNPLIFLELERDYKPVSCGNFHGEPIAMAMDFLGIAITELGSIAERRIFKMTDYRFLDTTWETNRQEKYGLPRFLIADPRYLSSGLMLPQYTAAALVSECKTLAHPDSVDSIPTSANHEDHVSMSLNAALHARQIVDHIEAVIAIELLCAAQALRYRERRAREKGEHLRPGAGTEAVLRYIESAVEYLDQDRVLFPDIRTLIAMVRSGELVRQARQATGYE